MLSVSAGSFVSFLKNRIYKMPESSTSLEQSIQSIRANAQTAAGNIVSPEDLEKFRIEFLARKGSVGQLFDELKSVPPDLKPALGKQLNELRAFVDSLYQTAKQKIESADAGKESFIDLTLPGRTPPTGTRHPITQTLRGHFCYFHRDGLWGC